MLGIIRVLTHDDAHFVEEHGHLIQQEYGIASISRCIDEQRNGIFDAASEALAVPKIIALGKALEAQGCTALFLSCAADPGLALLRAAVTIPVVAAGSASASIAAMLKRPVAVMGIGAAAPMPFRTLLGEEVLYARPEGVTKTTDLLTPEGRASALACADKLYQQGVEVIAFSCTGFSTIALADAIRVKPGRIAIDAVSAAGLFASQLV
ncbi:aspartate/glutamate racemase family protein [Kosakonia sp. ML.JS2a]|uniref:aspartate/glutamate racemase family protein n=1 Tax=Kosakonia sp. ML.JS2a TaxID=2980557 RepID=UPI0021D9C183|nr:aspartate/glutamate racemase family protein [Kosakonia sp. ML.JS2a]UXY10651.1 aspartate/glutamate racemase family protein [Kosakonia sp. ML.JS2a]